MRIIALAIYELRTGQQVYPPGSLQWMRKWRGLIDSNSSWSPRGEDGDMEKLIFIHKGSRQDKIAYNYNIY